MYTAIKHADFSAFYTHNLVFTFDEEPDEQ